MCLLWWRSTIPPLPTWCFHTDLPAPPPPPVITNVTPNYSKASTNYTNYCNNLIGKIPFYYKVRESQVRLYNNFPQNTILDKSLGTLAHFCSICHGNLSVRPPPPQFNVVYRDEVAIARFQHCQGGRGSLIPVMPLVIVSKIACQRMFQLSDPGVPTTFV